MAPVCNGSTNAIRTGESFPHSIGYLSRIRTHTSCKYQEWRISLWWLVWGRNATFYAVLCSYTRTVHITLCAVELQWHKMYRKCPQHPSNSFLTTAAERNKTSHRQLFLCLLGLFTPWYECVCDRFDCRQCCDSHAGIFKWNFDDPLWELCGIWTILINVWLPCMVNMQHSVWESWLTCGPCAWLTCSIQCGNLEYRVAPMHS